MILGSNLSIPLRYRPPKVGEYRRGRSPVPTRPGRNLHCWIAARCRNTGRDQRGTKTAQPNGNGPGSTATGHDQVPGGAGVRHSRKTRIRGLCLATPPPTTTLGIPMSRSIPATGSGRWTPLRIQAMDGGIPAIIRGRTIPRGEPQHRAGTSHRPTGSRSRDAALSRLSRTSRLISNSLRVIFIPRDNQPEGAFKLPLHDKIKPDGSWGKSCELRFDAVLGAPTSRRLYLGLRLLMMPHGIGDCTRLAP